MIAFFIDIHVCLHNTLLIECMLAIVLFPHDKRIVFCLVFQNIVLEFITSVNLFHPLAYWGRIDFNKC